MDVTGIPLRPYRGAPIRGGEHLASYSSLLPYPNTNNIHFTPTLQLVDCRALDVPTHTPTSLEGGGGVAALGLG